MNLLFLRWGSLVNLTDKVEENLEYNMLAAKKEKQ